MQYIKSLLSSNSQRKNPHILPPPRLAFQNTNESNRQENRELNFFESETEEKEHPLRKEVHLKQKMCSLDPWKKEILSILFTHIRNKSYSHNIKKFTSWYFEKHLGLNSESFERSIEMLHSDELNFLVTEKTSKYESELRCIKSALAILIKNRASLCDVDLSGLDLCDVQFSAPVDFTNAKFIGSNLSGLDFTQTILTGADLSYANLTKAELRDVHMEYSILDSTCLMEAILDGAHLRGVKLSNRYPNGPNLDKASLKGTNLTYANLQGGHFDKTDFSDCNCTLTRFNYATLKDTVFERCDLKGCQFTGASLYSVHFMNSDTSRSNFDNAVMIKTRMA
jgi:uncharacterized protein YjbI with pentapeptide repeats